MFHFSFSLSQSHYVSLYLFRLHLLSWSSLFSVFCSLWNSHQNGWMALYFNFPLKAEWPFFFFFSFSIACLTHLLNFALNQKLTLEAWGSKLINELWQGMWARPTCCFTPNTIGLSTKFNYHKEFKFNDWIIKMRIDIKIHIVNWNSSWFRCKLCISVSFSLPFCGPFCPLVVILLSFVVVFSTSFVVAPVAV